MKPDFAELHSRRGPARDGALVVFLFSAAVSLAYVYSGHSQVYDPWRHELLIEAVLSGRGFTLFNDAAYTWYSPVWYYPAALLKSLFGPRLTGALVSMLVPVFVHRLVGLRTGDSDTATLVAAAAAFYCPLILMTSGLGADGPALLTLLGALIAVETRSDRIGFLSAGLLFGISVAMRPNFLFAAALFIRPGRLSRFAWFVPTALLVLFALYLRNRSITAADPFNFSWDGLALPRETFSALSTLFPGMHPDVAAANERLNAAIKLFQIFPHGGVPHFGAVAFTLIGAAAALASRRLEWTLGLLSFTAMFAASGFSKTLYHFRLWLGLFPIFFAALGDVLNQIKDGSQKKRLGFALVFVIGFLGLDVVPPPAMPDKGNFLPPKGFLESVESGRAERWLVFSNGYNPEVLIHEHPKRRFLGLPWSPEHLKALEAAHPDHEYVLWHAFVVQRELHKHFLDLVAKGEYRMIAVAKNDFGVEFRALKRVRSPQQPVETR